MPMSGENALRPLARRLAVGLFLDVWPSWAAASLLAAGVVTLVGRLFVPALSPHVAWLWLGPAFAAVLVVPVVYRRSYTPGEGVALADALTGGRGTLLALFETGDRAWRASALAAAVDAVPLPRVRPWRRLAVLCPAMAFMAAAFWVPQRMTRGTEAPLAAEMARGLQAAVAEMKQEQLITPAEEQRLDEAIERIRRSAERRVDAAAWEAVDALRDTMAAGISEKQNALQWADEALARYVAGSKGAGAGDRDVSAAQSAEAAELMEALERLGQRGLLRGAPEDVRRLLQGGRLPSDAASREALVSAIAKHLREMQGRAASAAQLGKPAGRFDPSEVPLSARRSGGRAREGGRGGVDRGRGDADLTWGQETAPLDRFKDQALPPGTPRSPDEWTPVAELPGAPDTAPIQSAASAARGYDPVAGQAAWRRTLAPRHQSAVKKYFAQ
jgi:hypothetical protein